MKIKKRIREPAFLNRPVIDSVPQMFPALMRNVEEKEWEDYDNGQFTAPYCRICHHYKNQGHKVDCRVGRMLEKFYSAPRLDKTEKKVIWAKDIPIGSVGLVNHRKREASFAAGVISRK